MASLALTGHIDERRMADLYTPRTKDKLKRIALAQLDGILLPQVAADQQS